MRETARRVLAAQASWVLWAFGARPVLVLAVVAGTLFLARLPCALLEPEEARYAEIPRQMLVEGRFVTPVLHGEDYYQKPPLLYWLVMLCYSLFGVHDWAARLVPACAAIGTVLVSYHWARFVVGVRAAFLGGLILCLSARFVYLAGMLALDGLLCLWVTAALAAGHAALRGVSTRAAWVASGVLCGLGVLTKGPVAIVLVVSPLALLAWFEVRSRRIGWRGWALYAVVVAVVAGPWYLAVALQDAHATGAFFWLHNVLRYVAPFDHEEPAWFYLPSVFLGTLPWSLLLGPLTFRLLHTWPHWLRRRPRHMLFVLAFAWPLLFFSLSGCKRPGYILPTFPPLALVLGHYLARLLTVRHGSLGVPPRLLLARRLGFLALVVSLQLALVLAWLAAVARLWPWPFALAATLLVDAASVFLWRRRRSWRGAWQASAALMLGLFLVAALALLPEYHRRFSLRDIVTEVAGIENAAIVCYPKRWDSVSFYLQSPTRVCPAGGVQELPTLLGGDKSLVFVKNGPFLRLFLDSLPPERKLETCGQCDRLTVGVVR